MKAEELRYPLRITLVGTAFFVMALIAGCGGEEPYLACEDDPRWIARWTECDAQVLHRATASRWRDAHYSARLRTSGDFVAALMTPRQVRAETGGDVSLLINRASEFERCISEAVRADELADVEIAEVAAACGVLLGYTTGN